MNYGTPYQVGGGRSTVKHTRAPPPCRVHQLGCNDREKWSFQRLVWTILARKAAVTVAAAVLRLPQVMTAPAARFCSSSKEKGLSLRANWAGSTRMLPINPELRCCPLKLKVPLCSVNIITTAFSFAAKLGQRILPLWHHCTHGRISNTKSNLRDHKRAGLKRRLYTSLA